MFDNKKITPLVHALGFTFLSKVSGLIKCSFVLGSYASFFSASNMVVPLAGAFGGVAGSCAVFGLSVALRMLFGGIGFAKLAAFYVPGFCASLYWAAPNLFVRLLLPLLCIALFVMHPVGWYAAPYALYWLIPVVLYFIPRKNIWLHAFSSTFIAHAVGSVIWLYMVPMTVAMWYALLPIVIVERVLFASGMALTHSLIEKLVGSIGSRYNVLYNRFLVKKAAH